MEKFRTDMNSDAVAQKIAFDRKLSEARKLSYTPLIYVGSEQVKQSEMGADFLVNMRSKINAQLEK